MANERASAMRTAPGQKKGYALIATVYLLGLFIGALDTGIVTPGRTVIQNDLGVDDQMGVWLITIYTLAYAAAIPLMGKLADRHGRKYIYLGCVVLFGLGSLGCGLAQDFDSFAFLLVSRVVQAIGGGGIVPIATAEFGTAFPEEKRGMALGLVGGVYGIANVFGASAGSLILDIFGQGNWQFIFYINVPICIFIIVAGLFVLPNARTFTTKPIDALGTVVLVVMVLSLLYGLKGVDFFDLSSFASFDVYPFLIVFVLLLPLFIVIERRAADPILNLSYFSNPNIVLTMVLSIITGVILMGVIFIPQFAENATFLPSGKGGYWVILLGVFAGVGSPISGKLIDRFGVKFVLGIGLVASAIGAFYLALVAAVDPNVFNVIVSFILIGSGLGFIIGTPINYMMLENTADEEANSALATLSLMRSIGTAVAPALMVAFLAHSGALVQDRVMEVLPDRIEISALPYQDEITAQLDKMKNDEATKDMIAEGDFPDLASYRTIDVDMTAETQTYSVPEDIVELMKDSDVTTIVANTKVMTRAMFAQIAPDQIRTIDEGIEKGREGMRTADEDMAGAIVEIRGGADELAAGIRTMDDALARQRQARVQMTDMLPSIAQIEHYTSILDLMPASVRETLPEVVVTQLSGVRNADDLRASMASLQAGIDAMNARSAQLTAECDLLRAQLVGETDPVRIADIQAQIAQKEASVAQLDGLVATQKQMKDLMGEQMPVVEKLSSYTSVLDLMPDSVRATLPQSMIDSLAGVKTSADMEALISDLDTAIEGMTQARGEMFAARGELLAAIAEMEGARLDIDTTRSQLATLKAALPSAFAEAESVYLEAISDRSEEIETVFRDTLNEGFAGLFSLVGWCAVAGLGFLVLYRGKPRGKMETESTGD